MGPDENGNIESENSACNRGSPHKNESPGALPKINQAQRHLANEELLRRALPIDLSPNRAAFERVGFRFGEPLAEHPGFVSVAYPPGWRVRHFRSRNYYAIWDDLGLVRIRVDIAALLKQETHHSADLFDDSKKLHRPEVESFKQLPPGTALVNSIEQLHPKDEDEISYVAVRSSDGLVSEYAAIKPRGCNSLELQLEFEYDGLLRLRLEDFLAQAVIMRTLTESEKSECEESMGTSLALPSTPESSDLLAHYHSHSSDCEETEDKEAKDADERARRAEEERAKKQKEDQRRSAALEDLLRLQRELYHAWATRMALWQLARTAEENTKRVQEQERERNRPHSHRHTMRHSY